MFARLFASVIDITKVILFLIYVKYMKSEKPFCIFSKIHRDPRANCWGQEADSLILEYRGWGISRQQGLELRAKTGALM